MRDKTDLLLQGIILIHQAEWHLLEQHLQDSMVYFSTEEKWFYENFLRAYQLIIVGRTRDASNYLDVVESRFLSYLESKKQKARHSMPWTLLFWLLRSLVLLDMGEMRKSRRLLNKILLHPSVRDYPVVMGLCYMYIGFVNILSDSFDQVKKYLDEATALLKDPTLQFLKSEIFRLKSLIAFQEGKLRHCAELLAASIGVAETFNDKIARIHVLLTKAQLHFERAQFELALDLIDEALEIGQQSGLLKDQIEALFFKIQLEHQVGNIEKALQKLKELENLRKLTGYQRKLLDIKCLASKIYLSLDNPQKALEQLDEAAQIFPNSLKVQAYLSLFLLTQNYYGLSKSLLELSLERLQHFELVDLYIMVLFLLAEVELIHYRVDRDEQRITRALSYLQNVTHETIKEKRKRITYYAMLAQFHLALLSFDLQSAKLYLDNVMTLFDDDLPMEFLPYVSQAEASFVFFENYMKSSSESRKERPFSKESLQQMSLDNTMMLLQEMTLGPKAKVNLAEYDNETRLMLFVQKESGPSAILSDQGKIMEDTTTILAGVVYSSVVAQGNRYYQGLFGPLPYAQDGSQALVYSTMLPDSKSPDPRYKGRNYCLFVLIFPRTLSYYNVNRGKIQRAFERFISRVADVSKITVNDLRQLKREIIKYFSASWL